MYKKSYRIPNGPNYDYHFIIKKFTEEFKIQFKCLRENSEIFTIFTVSIENKVTRIDKNREEITKHIFYILQFTDSARFIASSLSNLVNNLSEGIHSLKCKFGHDDKKCQKCRIKYKYCNCFF